MNKPWTITSGLIALSLFGIGRACDAVDRMPRATPEQASRYVCDQARDKRAADMTSRDMDILQVCRANGL
jgi:hypothetical protein